MADIDSLAPLLVRIADHERGPPSRREDFREAMEACRGELADLALRRSAAMEPPLLAGLSQGAVARRPGTSRAAATKIVKDHGEH